MKRTHQLCFMSTLCVLSCLLTQCSLFEDKWEPVREDVKAVLLEASEAATSDSVATESVIRQATVMCTHTRRVTKKIKKSGKEAKLPEDITAVNKICNAINVIEVAEKLPLMKKPLLPVEPRYMEPEYDGAFRFEGEYLKRGSNLLMERKDKLYLLPFATVAGDSSWGKARGYVRPLGKESMVEGRMAQYLDVVTYEEMLLDQKMHKEAVAKAEADYKNAREKHDMIRAKYPKEIATYENYQAKIDLSDKMKKALYVYMQPLSKNLGIDVLADKAMIVEPTTSSAPKGKTVELVKLDYVGAKISASSAFMKKHPPKHAFDGDQKTAWNESDKGAGEGEWIEISFPDPQTIARIDLSSGWDHISKKGVNLFEKNSRIKKVKILFDGKEEITQTSDEFTRMIEISDLSQTASTIRFEIIDVWPGTKWKDLCISEITIFGDM